MIVSLSFFRWRFAMKRRDEMSDDLNTAYFTIHEASDYVRLAKRTLDNMRWMGTGPIFRKHGGWIFYHIDELKEWSLESRSKSTSEY
jgi:hypothetical protein